MVIIRRYGFEKIRNYFANIKSNIYVAYPLTLDSKRRIRYEYYFELNYLGKNIHLTYSISSTPSVV